MSYLTNRDYGYVNSEEEKYNPDILCRINNKIIFIGEAPGRSKIIIRKNKVIFRDINEDLNSIRQLCIKHIICLVEDYEFIKYNMGNYISLVEDKGIKISHYPIIDGGVPSLELMLQIVTDIGNSILQNNILIHCMAGLGRTGLISACFLVSYGYDPENAINITQLQRRGTITRENQKAFVHEFYKFYQQNPK